MLDSHRDACVFDGRVKILARAALAVNLKTVAPEDLKMRGYGNVDMTIEGVAKERAAFFFDTDDAHRQAANFQRLSDRIFVRKELVLMSLPNTTTSADRLTSSSEMKRPSAMV